MKKYLIACALIATASAANADIIDTRLNIPVVDCPSGATTEPCRPSQNAALIPGKAAPRSTFITREAFFPPGQYDHPYDGRVTIIRGNGLCPKHAAKSMVLGCSYREEKPKRCTIIIVTDDTLARERFTYEAVLRHETAHCNGWGPDHPNAQGRAE